MSMPLPSITGGASGPATGGTSGIGSTNFSNGGLTVFRDDPVMKYVLIGVVVFLIYSFMRKKK